MEAKHDKYVRVEPAAELPGCAPRGNSQGKWDDVRAKLAAAPGQWFLVAAVPVAEGNARKLAAGAALSMVPRRKGFESAVRTVDGERRVYARYVGAK